MVQSLNETLRCEAHKADQIMPVDYLVVPSEETRAWARQKLMELHLAPEKNRACAACSQPIAVSNGTFVVKDQQALEVHSASRKEMR